MFKGNGNCNFRRKIGVEPWGFVLVATMANLLKDKRALETVSAPKRECRTR